jgi:multiple sugar transport system substrate-binding protein
MDKIFDTAVINSVSIKQNIYALPLSYYQLGFYYYKPLFAKMGITEPQTWAEFLSICELLKLSNVTPIYIGTKTNWPATAWFDYLNLRLNGIEFHMALMQGQASYLDNRVSQVLQKLNELSQAGYFIQDHQDLEWKQGLPLLFRGLIGMSMLGNYAIQSFPEKIKDKIGFFKFPMLTDSNIYHEEAPLDVFVMPTKSKNNELAKTFIQFAAQSDVQEQFNKSQGVLSPHKNAQQNNSNLVQEAYEVITKAEGITRFFDRDSKKAYADLAMPIIDTFMLELNITDTQQALEKVRLKYFNINPIPKTIP